MAGQNGAGRGVPRGAGTKPPWRASATVARPAVSSGRVRLVRGAFCHLAQQRCSEGGCIRAGWRTAWRGCTPAAGGTTAAAVPRAPRKGARLLAAAMERWCRDTRMWSPGRPTACPTATRERGIAAAPLGKLRASGALSTRIRSSGGRAADGGSVAPCRVGRRSRAPLAAGVWRIVQRVAGVRGPAAPPAASGDTAVL